MSPPSMSVLFPLSFIDQFVHPVGRGGGEEIISNNKSVVVRSIMIFINLKSADDIVKAFLKTEAIVEI